MTDENEKLTAYGCRGCQTLFWESPLGTPGDSCPHCGAELVELPGIWETNNDD